MDLLGIRKWFVRDSGRYDLISDATTWADLGANDYIYAGQKLLDRKFSNKHSVSRNLQTIAAGVSSVKFQDCRSIEAVFVQHTGTGERTELLKDTLRLIKELQYSTTDPGTPAYYSPAVLRTTPKASAGDYSEFLDIVDNAHLYNSAVFTPKTDAAYVVEVWGNFYEPQLINDEDSNYWSSLHPELLIMAAQCMLEGTLGDSSAYSKWMQMIDSVTTSLEMDALEEKIMGITRMEG